MDVFIFLTDIMAKPWYTHAGSRLGKVVDFAADGSETYPRVTDFVCRRGRRDRVRVPWEAVARLEKDGVYLREQESGRLEPYERRPGEILLVADILDKQIVDVNGVALPGVIFCMLVLINDRRLMGNYVNGPVRNIISGVTAAVLAALSVAMIAISVF